MTLGRVNGGAQVEVIDRVLGVFPRAAALLAGEVEERAPPADPQVAVEVAPVTARDLRIAPELPGTIRRQVIDHAANRLRSEVERVRAFEYLDPDKPVDRRMVVGCIVAVGRVRQRHAVLKEGDLRGPRGIEPAHANVWPQAKAFLVAHRHAWHPPQRLVDRKDAALLQRALTEGIRRPANHRQTFAFSNHLKAGMLDDLARSCTPRWCHRLAPQPGRAKDRGQNPENRLNSKRMFAWREHET